MKKTIALLSVIACIVAAGEVSALDDPPVEPTYERPSFERPSPPEPPRPPEEPDPKRRISQKSETWDLICTFKRGGWQGKYNPLVLTTMFSTRVDPGVYPEGAKFCRALSPSRDVSIRCENHRGEVRFSSSISLNAAEAREGRSFCYRTLSSL